MAAEKLNTVIVGCKLPHGWVIHLDDGKRVKLNGANTALLINGYGTTIVDKTFADKWFAVNKSHPAVVSGAVFVSKDLAAAQDQAEEQQGIVTGFEQLDATKPVAGADVTKDAGEE